MPQTVLITGTSSGIGEALAARYLESGWNVWGVSRRPNAKLEEFEQYRFLSLDLTDWSKVESEAPKFFSENDSLELVILNAGALGEIRDMSRVSLDELNRLMDINVWANKILLDILFGSISEIRQVVAISSGAAVNGNRGWNGYSISKAALNMLIQLYAREQESTHFCALAPGLVDTAMQDYLCELPEDPRYLAVEKLKAARNTEAMPSPEKAATMLQDTISRLPDLVESGKFADVRTMDLA